MLDIGFQVGVVDSWRDGSDDARSVTFAFRINQFGVIEGDIADIVVYVQLDPVRRYRI